MAHGDFSLEKGITCPPRASYLRWSSSCSIINITFYTGHLSYERTIGHSRGFDPWNLLRGWCSDGWKFSPASNSPSATAKVWERRLLVLSPTRCSSNPSGRKDPGQWRRRCCRSPASTSGLHPRRNAGPSTMGWTFTGCPTLEDSAPPEAEKQLLSLDQRKLLAFLPAFQQDTTSGLWSLVNGEEGTETRRLYIPHVLRHRIIEAAHQFLGYAGITATAQFCRKRVFMLRLIPEVHRAIQHCHPYKIKSQKAPTQKDVHRLSIQAGVPFQVWSMDILGPLRVSSEGNQYLLTLKDVFSRWFEAIPLSHTTSEKVLCALQFLYARFGHPLQVHTDNATYFRSQLMQEAFRRASIRQTFTPTYNPQSNSVERVHRNLNTILRVLCHQHAADWEEAALLALRSAVHESTGVTRFACIYGGEPAAPLDLLSLPGISPCRQQLRSPPRGTPVQGPSDGAGPARQSPPAQCPAIWGWKGHRSDWRKGMAVHLQALRRSETCHFLYRALEIVQQLSGTIHSICPEGNWCAQPKTITMSLNRLKRCHVEERAPQQVSFDLAQLEDATDDAEGPMRNAWITTEGAAASASFESGRRRCPRAQPEREKNTELDYRHIFDSTLYSSPAGSRRGCSLPCCPSRAYKRCKSTRSFW